LEVFLYSKDLFPLKTHSEVILSHIFNIEGVVEGKEILSPPETPAHSYE
jgi:hypothetical protein